MKSFGLALLLAVLASVSPDPAKEANEYPYIVSIHRNSSRRDYICAGSLITTSWVLTSANCLPKIAYKIRYGDMLALNATTRLILNRIRHMNSKSLYHEVAPNRLTPKTNNIALALIEEIPNRQLGLLSGNDYFTILGHEVTYFEFGFLPVFKARIYANKNRIYAFPNKNRFQKILKVKESYGNGSGPVPVGTKALRTDSGVAITCPNRNHPGPNICVAKKCFGSDASDSRDLLVAPDYGAPLVHDGRIVGVTSEVEQDYSRFTPVSPYFDWIGEQIKEEVVCG